MSLEERIAAVLADHEIEVHYGDQVASCKCRAWDDDSDTPHRAHVTPLIAALFTEHAETIPVWVDDVPPAFGPFAELVDGRVIQLPRRHSEWFDHTRHTTPWHSDDCPDCTAEPGVHDWRQAEMQAAAQERSR